MDKESILILTFRKMAKKLLLFRAGWLDQREL